MKIVADLHCHTNVSNHAWSSLQEMAEGAKNAGHIAIAITNHGPAMVDGAHQWHFDGMRILPRSINGVYILRGIEFNILPPVGGVDGLPLKTVEGLDFCIASFHETCFPPADCRAHTMALEGILRNPYVTVLGHMGNPVFEFEQEKIISQCNEFEKIVEINANSVNVRQGSSENCTNIAKLCMKYNVPVMVNSDAHISYAVGKVNAALELLEKIDFPEELIINADAQRLRDFFLKKRGIDIFETDEE